MALTPFPIEQFGGFRLDVSPEEIGHSAAVDLANVDFDQKGRLRCRDGFTQVKSFTATSVDGFATFETTSGTKQFIVAYTNSGTLKYEAYASSGGAAVASATPTNTRVSAARVGTPSNQYLYIGNGVDTVWRWTGSAWSQPAGMPKALYLTVDGNSNRLVGAVTINGESSIEWSDPGAPETWNSSNTLQLAPGDGSFISGLASWQDYVFAFKRQRFFVFTGESVDADGGAVFNYHTIDGYGAIVPPAAGDEGVYFFDGAAIWLTTGGIPTRVSRAIEPILQGTAGSLGTSVVADTTKLTTVVLSYVLGRLYVSFTTGLGTARGVLVFDPKIDQWTYYDFDAAYFASVRHLSDMLELYAFGSMGGSEQVMYQAPLSSSDPGGNVTWFYRSGQYNIGPPEQVSVILDTSVIGSVVAGSTSIEHNTDRVDVSATVDLTGASGSTLLGDVEAWTGKDAEGRRWFYRLGGTGRSVIACITHYVSFVKPAGIE